MTVARAATRTRSPPLSAFAHFTRKSEPLLLSRQGIFPAVTLSFNLTPGVSLGQAVSVIQAMRGRLHVPLSLNSVAGAPGVTFRPRPVLSCLKTFHNCPVRYLRR